MHAYVCLPLNPTDVYCRRLKKQKQERKNALEQLRKEQNLKIGADSETDKRTRLETLMRQSELFTHFITGEGPLQKKMQEYVPTAT